MNILWLGDPACHDTARVGGKAANLSRLADIHHVPPGFCLTAVAYQNALAAGLFQDQPDKAPQNFPTDIHDELVLTYQALAEQCKMDDPSVAVRSSAVDEDGADSSFAGQHETFLNIVGRDALVESVVRCWASARSERALAYRRQQGLTFDGAWLAVLVQQLIVADTSAVVFSANPVTGSRDEVLINASWGLGESIVGGTVTPDTFIVRKSDHAVTSRQVAEKQRMTVAVDDGTTEVDVPRFLRSQPAITDDQAIEMAQLTLTLEDTMGWPVDVECAYQGDQLYLLQCRPVTALNSK